MYIAPRGIDWIQKFCPTFLKLEFCGRVAPYFLTLQKTILLLLLLQDFFITLELRQDKNDKMDWKNLCFEFAAFSLSPNRRPKERGYFKTKKSFRSILSFLSCLVLALVLWKKFHKYFSHSTRDSNTDSPLKFLSFKCLLRNIAIFLTN